MSRYLGPIWKKSRSYNYPFLEKKEFSRGKKRITRPGIHFDKKKRYSTYALQNLEKQKMRFLYGLRETQLCNQFHKIKKFWNSNTKNINSEIGDNLLINCECRLDNLIFRTGLAPTRRFARQLVSHGHFLIDNKRIKSPGYKLKNKQIITLRNKKLINNKIIQESIKRNIIIPNFINFDKEKLIITYIKIHTIEDKELIEIKKRIDTSSVTEWYNRSS